MWLATMTSKGQLTVPKEMRERFGIRDHDRVMFSLENGKIVLTPLPKPTAAGLAGALPSNRPYPGADAIREQVERSIADEVLDDAGEE
jgi:antitoxin PrlF